VAIKAAADGSIELPGTFPVHDLVDVGVELTGPPGQYATIAGLVLVLLGRIPEEPGDVVQAGDWKIEVRAVEHHAITRVRLRSQAKPRNEVDL
jgi:putative hemolysin